MPPTLSDTTGVNARNGQGLSYECTSRLEINFEAMANQTIIKIKVYINKRSFNDVMSSAFDVCSRRGN